MLWSPKCTFSISLSTKMLYPSLALPRVPDYWLRNSSVARKFIYIRSTCCAQIFSYFYQKFVLLRRWGGLDFIVTVLRTGGFEVRIPSGARYFFSLLQNAQTGSGVHSAHLLIRIDGKAAGAWSWPLIPMLRMSGALRLLPLPPETVYGRHFDLIC